MSNDRYDDAKPLKSVIERYLKVTRMDIKIDEASILDAWEKVMGTFIANKSSKLYVQKGTLYVTIDSAIIKKEISLEKQRAVTLLNEFVGKEVISDIVVR